MTKLFQKPEVLHIPGTDLNHIYICKCVQLAFTHDFRNNGKSCFFLCQKEKPESLLFQPLKRVRRRSRLKGTASQKGCAASFYRFSHKADLLFCFNRTGTCNHGKISFSNLLSGHLNHRIFRMEATVSQFKGFRDPPYIRNNRDRPKPVFIQMRRIADQAQYRFCRALAVMDVDILFLNLFNQLIYGLPINIGF